MLEYGLLIFEVAEQVECVSLFVDLEWHGLTRHGGEAIDWCLSMIIFGDRGFEGARLDSRMILAWFALAILGTKTVIQVVQSVVAIDADTW